MALLRLLSWTWIVNDAGRYSGASYYLNQRAAQDHSTYRIPEETLLVSLVIRHGSKSGGQLFCKSPKSG